LIHTTGKSKKKKKNNCHFRAVHLGTLDLKCFAATGNHSRIWKLEVGCCHCERNKRPSSVALAFLWGTRQQLGGPGQDWQ
jgi:hypothetical protein